MLLFDGAMSNARMRVNGREVAWWPYGYNSFVADITSVAVPGENRIEVSLENFEKASRWYPGAGLYRNVHLISTNKVHIPVWGTRITTPVVHDDYASVALEIEVEGLSKIRASIWSPISSMPRAIRSPRPATAMSTGVRPSRSIFW